jgi:hypothetical protein
MCSHWRTNKDRADPLGDTAFPYLVSMCNTAGGLLRVFEVCVCAVRTAAQEVWRCDDMPAAANVCHS